MRFTFRAVLVCVAATNLTANAFAPSSLRRATSVSSHPHVLSASFASGNKLTKTVLASSTTADAVPAEEPKPQGAGTATVSE